MAKSIGGSVGLGGSNQSKDIMTIQYLLNCVPPNKGGPPTELAVDGKMGPKTLAAIKNFQQANSPVSDGRVDPGKATLVKLQSFDPQGGSPMNVSDAKHSAAPGAKGGFASKGVGGKAGLGIKEAFGEKGGPGGNAVGFGQKAAGEKFAGGGQKFPGTKFGGFGGKDAGAKWGGKG
jgi:peptidoglycan hydrolase-like protein with peptidoglycan-binding domain